MCNNSEAFGSEFPKKLEEIIIVKALECTRIVTGEHCESAYINNDDFLHRIRHVSVFFFGRPICF